MANLTPLILNNVASTVQAGSSAIGSASATGVNVASGDGANFGTIGTNQFIPAVVLDGSTTPETVKEYVWITARSTDALTVVRQAEESTRYAASTTSIQAGYTITAVVTSNALYVGAAVRATSLLPRDVGYFAWTFDPATSAGASNTLAKGALNLARVQVPVTIPVSNIVVYLRGAGATLTSGQCLAGIYDSTGNRLAVTGDQSTAWTSTGLKTMAVTGAPVSITGGPDAFVFIALLVNGTTAPGMWVGGPGDATFDNVGTTAATSRAGTNGSGLTALPSTFTPSATAATSGFYFGALS